MMATLKKRRNSKGFTLMEVLISIGLIAIALVAVFRLQAQNLDFQAEARNITLTRYLAMERLSIIHARQNPGEGSDSGDFGEDFPDYAYEEVIEAVQDQEGLYRAKVTVFPKENRKTYSLTVETCLYRTSS